ncbi:MAG: lipopolysaccharide biosynthesis protein [Bacteroidaceae bacterium]|nr:lipopolysaccharide biosynthesis protein [Bacteroidaceae bacterium]
MSTNSEANKRIAKNTMLLYIRMGVMMIISFFTARITLEALGVVDYGINNVVGGLVSMFSLISSSLSSSVSRFITFGLGKGDKKELNTIFSTSVNIHVILAIIVVIAIETIGIWFLNNKMVIPVDRLTAAHWVLQCSTSMFAIGLLSVPYNATIIAHERMDVYAYFTLFDAFSRLAIIFAIKYYGGDKLILLAIISLIPSLIKQFYYWHFSKKHFEECTYHAVWDKKVFKEMFGFAGWNFFGNAAFIMNTQGINMLINIFYGVTLNAARGIAVQVMSIVEQFTGNFTAAINPQITKSCASGDNKHLYFLIEKSSKFNFFLMLILVTPVILECKTLLELWLGEIPDHTVNFVILNLIRALTIIMSNSLLTAILATGKIKQYQTIVIFTTIWVFILTYFAFDIGLPPETTYIIHICIYVILIIIRIVYAKKLIGLDYISFIKNVVFRCLYVLCLVSIAPIIIAMTTEPEILRLLVSVPTTIIYSIFIIYLFGLDSGEKNSIKRILCRRLKKINLKKNH